MKMHPSLRSVGIVPLFIAALAPMVFASGLAAQESAQQPVGPRAVNAVIRQVTLDPTILVPKTGKPLPTTGSWSIGKEPPSSCPQGSQCITVFYRVPEDEVTCQWTVDLSTDQGAILDQNPDASLYLIRKLSLDQAKALVLTRKKPVYPPIAHAAHVSGEVVLRVYVSPAGEISHVQLISGPDMLRFSAIDAVKAWTFKPFLVGTQAAAFETDVFFDFKTSGSGSTSINIKP